MNNSNSIISDSMHINTISKYMIFTMLFMIITTSIFFYVPYFIHDRELHTKRTNTLHNYTIHNYRKVNTSRQYNNTNNTYFTKRETPEEYFNTYILKDVQYYYMLVH